MDDQKRPRFVALLRTHHAVPFLDRTYGFVRSLPAGDQLIVSILSLILIGTSVVALYRLERSILVPIPEPGGSLTEGVVGSPRFVNPLLAITDADRDLTVLTYAGLMGVGSDGTVVPVLAESYTISPDGKLYTFTLRKGVKFSDGTPVTAEDVVFTVQKAQDPALKSPELADWANVAAQAVDSRTVRFVLPKPYAPFLQITTLGILPARLWRNIPDSQFPFSPLVEKPVGAGPFTVGDVKRDSLGIIEEYTLNASGRYILGRPYLDTLKLKFYAQQNDLVAALSRHAVEAGYGVPAERVLQAPYARVFGVFFNPVENPAFAHLEVRKALSVAIDRDHIVKDILGGYATPLAGPVPPGSGISEPPVPSSSGRIEAASKILTSAGWKYDSSARAWTDKTGKTKLAVTLKTSNVPELKAEAGAIKDNWESIGVPTTVELYEPGDLTQNVIRPRKYDALLFGMVVGRDRDLFAFWDSGERNDPGLNIALYANKTVDQLLMKFRQESDTRLRVADLSQISALIVADYPAAFTHTPDFLYSVPADLQGAILPQIAAPSDRYANVARWYRRTDMVWPFLAPR